jgi:hypothetical protein
MPEFRIVIPSRGRFNLKLTTLDYIPKSLRSVTCVMVSKNEYQRYLNNKDIKEKEIKVVVCSKNGISEVRQYIITNYASHEKVNCVIMLDDDMAFYKRNFIDFKLRKASLTEMRNLLVRMYKISMKKGYFACGLSARQGNNRMREPIRFVGRMMNAYAINIPTLRKNNVRFNEVEVMEDFQVTLSMLKLGYRNAVIYDHCWNQLGSGRQGGCSEYRDEAMQNKAALYLFSKFPDEVKIVKKKSSSGWKDMKERTDVNIRWRKAYENRYCK